MEYALPINRGLEAMAAIRDLMLTRHPEVRWAVEFRTHGGEDAF